MKISEMLVQYALDRYHQELPMDVAGSAKMSIYDSLGCMITGSQDPCFLKLRQYLKQYGGCPSCSVISADQFRTDAEHASALNAMAAHIRDYDDMCAVLYGHATSAVFSSVLAIGEQLQCSGMDLLKAFVAGVDVAALMGRGLVANGYPHACDSSSTLSIFGVTTAAGLLMGLEKGQLINAFGIAASESAGLRANYGTAAKDLTAARTASRGIYAANMASLGFDSNPEIVEDYNGFLAACGSQIDLKGMRKIINAGNSIYGQGGMRIKNYPTCGGTHCAMDAAIFLRNQYKISWQEISHIQCLVQDTAMASDKYPIPSNPVQGKFSIAYCVAVALFYGYGYINAFCGNEFPVSELMDLVYKTEVIQDDSLYTDALDGAQVTLFLKDGRELTKKVDYCTGSVGKELTVRQRKDKFTRCIKGLMPKEMAETCYEAVQGLEQYQDIRVFINTVLISMKTENKG